MLQSGQEEQPLGLPAWDSSHFQKNLEQQTFPQAQSFARTPQEETDRIIREETLTAWDRFDRVQKTLPFNSRAQWTELAHHAFSHIARNTPQPPENPELFREITQWANTADPDIAKSITMPFAIERMLWECQHFQKGQAQENAKTFYEHIGSEQLTAIASETTGDTKQELERLSTVMEWMRRQGKTPVRYLDVGSGDGKRLLEPFLQAHGEDIQSSVYTIDLVNNAPDIQGKEIQHLQGDITSLGNGQYRRDWHIPLKSLGLITCSWSVLCDLPPLDQMQAFHAFSETLAPGGILVVDIPDRPEGGFWRSFQTENGSFQKEFYVPSSDTLMLYGLSEGMRQINRMKWQTESGYDRTTLILENPPKLHQEADQVLVGSSR